MSAQTEGAAAQAPQASQPGRSPAIKFILVVAMTIAMAVPLFMINATLESREQSASEAAADIAASWGRSQTVAGIYLVIPYTTNDVTYDGARSTTVVTRHTITVLPQKLVIGAAARTETRSRGIYNTTAYTADVRIAADFGPVDTTDIPHDATILWSEAKAIIGLSDLRGLNENPVLSVNGKNVPFDPGTGEAKIAISAINARLNLDGPPTALSLKTAVPVRGTSELTFVALGRDTTIDMHSTWPSPSFFGGYLPVNRTIGAGGFDAKWMVPYIARGFGNVDLEDRNSVNLMLNSAFGVRFFQPVDFYSLVDRSLKYGILVVGLTFFTFFIFELMVGARLHFIQYAMIGTAQVLFYLLLLSISEHVGFDIAYALGAIGVVGLTTAYGISVLGGVARAALLGVILTALYGALYFLLQLEDYALLIGSLFLFAVLALTMYLTRNIDWYRGFSLAPG